MKKLGFKFRKVGSIPVKANLEEQEELKKTLNPEIKKAKSLSKNVKSDSFMSKRRIGFRIGSKNGKTTLIFLDSVHFVHRSFLGYIWTNKRLFLPSPSGRKRRNILGAYNALTRKLTTLANDEYITASTVCEMLRKLSREYVGTPITIVLDNARYQRCNVVVDLARDLNIPLYFLPSYSPNLNLIERLWKLVKKKCLYNKYYRTFAEFKAGIDDCLTKIETVYQTEVKTLMTLNFQSFKKDHIMTL